MELLLFGQDVKVLQPESLADEIKQVHYNAFKLYWYSPASNENEFEDK